MNKTLLAFSTLTATAMTPTAVSAVTLLDIVDIPNQFYTPYALTFTANASTSTISFAGYDAPANYIVSSIGLFLNNSGPSIISSNGSSFTLTRAPSGSNALASGPFLYFQGTTVGSYDIFSQSANTIAGSSYTLRFDLNNQNGNRENGLRVEASNATVGAIPEPATWAMMLVGFGMIGATARYRRRSITTTYA